MEEMTSDDGRETDHEHNNPGGIGREFAESTPGFEYEHRPVIEQLTGYTEMSRGEQLTEVAMMGPINIMGRIRPTRPLTWVTWGVAQTTALVVWWFTIGLVLMIGGICWHLLEESWKEMRERGD